MLCPRTQTRTFLRRLESPGGVPRLGLILVVALLVAIGYGLYLRRAHEAALARVTAEASVLSVSVVHPTTGIAGR